MLTSPLSEVSRFKVNIPLVEKTLSVLQEYGRQSLEGLALWLGDVQSGTATVSELFVPEQLPVSSEDGVGYFVSGDTLFRLNQMLSMRGLRLLAQVHSHPGEAYHSRTDDEFAIVTSEGGLSLVVPDFGYTASDPRHWAVYRLQNGEWREMKSADVNLLLDYS